MSEEELREQFHKQGQELLVLRMCCATLIGELALTRDKPREEFDRITSSLQGVVSGVAAQAGDQSAEMTKSLEKLLEIAEAGFPNDTSPDRA